MWSSSIAGSDTTSNSSCAILFFLAKNPECQEKLVKAIEAHFGPDVEGVLDYEQVQKVKYLDYCIKVRGPAVLRL
jgi:benzoate 4-monooxygenase